MGDSSPSLLPTQRPLTLVELSTLLAPLGTVVGARLLSGGTFSAVQAATLHDGSEVVVKTSVPDAPDRRGRSRLLTYEADMLRSEHDILERVRDLPGIPAPRMVLADFSRAVAEVDAVVMELVPGTPWDTVVESMTPEANDAAYAHVGAILAELHTIEGDTFGYPARGFELGAATWPAFFTRLIASVVADARTWDVDIEADRLLAAVDKGAEALAQVTTPRLIHNDLWHGNVLLDPSTGSVHGVVDFERCMYGDPLWDLVGAESMSTSATTPAILRGYEAAGGILPRDPAAGTVTGFDSLADLRTTLYRLWAMSVQFIEIVPRGFHGDWVVGHRAQIQDNRAALFARLGV